MDKESLNSYATNGASMNESKANTTVSGATPGNGTFKFSNLFTKRDKSDKHKHSSLKRAKSGIQLERKKTVNGANNGSGSNANESKASNHNSTLNPSDYDQRQK